MNGIFLCVFFLSSLCYAQVGIGTKDPVVTLQVVGSPDNVSVYDGIIPPKLTGDQLKLKNYTDNHEGAIVYITEGASLANRNGQTINVTSSGYYYFSLPELVWFKYQTKANNWMFDNNYSTTAINRVDYPLTVTESGSVKVNNIDLGISSVIKIPAKSQAKVIVNYSVPIGLRDINMNPKGYFGIRFLKNGNEAPLGSRKVTLFTNPLSESNNSQSMNNISATYVEEIQNNSANELTIIYSLNGYIEQTFSENINPNVYVFNLWALTGDNKNWGRATMNIQVYKKDL